MPAARSVIEHVPRDAFWPLPRPRRADGQPRRTGIEIEFAGLDEAAAAALVQRLWGGDVQANGAQTRKLAGGRFGTVTVERDTALSDRGAEGLVLDALGDLVPVEIVTAPLAPEDLPQADRLVAALRAAGARGTRASPAFGFGLHLNPEVAEEDAAFIVPVVRAFGLLEDWLRASAPPDLTRRLMPFVDPWPRALVDRLAGAADSWGLSDLTVAYLDHAPSRNHGLDLLPLLEWLDPDGVRSALPEGQAKGGRPTFHYRLPEARVDEADWTIAREWNRWVIVERVAARPALLAALAEGWQAHRAALTSLRGDWAREVEQLLAGARIWEP